MKNDLSEIVCIVDRSGSMQAIRSDAIGGFNSFLNSQQKLPGEARFTLVLFDHDYEVLHDCVPLPSVPPLDEDSYTPRGTTALLDAIGRTIDDVGKRLAKTPEADRPANVIVAILTDGMENASSDYRQQHISEMIAHQQEVYDWEFLFLAANQDAIATASKMSIKAANAANFMATGAGIQSAYADLDRKVTARRGKKA